MEETFITKIYSRGKEYTQKNIKNVSFKKEKNQGKQGHHEDIDKNIIQALKKLDTSYNPDYIDYINDKFKDMMIEDTPQEKSLIHQYHTDFSALSSGYLKP